MTDILTRASAQLLTPYNLDLDGIDHAMADLMGPGIDFGDFYFQHSKRENWTFEDGIVKDGAHSIEQGVGVRAVSGEKTGFAYSDAMDAAALRESALAARAISASGANQAHKVAAVRAAPKALYDGMDPIAGMPADEKVALLRAVDAYVRAKEARVIKVTVSLAGALDTILVLNSAGVLAADIRPLVRVNVQVI
ncbi:MAG: hypothetical protein RI923_144, partial [Pseudomonadota bacterium]